MTAAARVVNAIPAGRLDDAIALAFEYMAANQAEAGRPPPDSIGELTPALRAEAGRPPPAAIGELPPVLRHECHNLAAVYRPPGALLVAYQDWQPAGCVGLAPCSQEHTAG